MAAGLFNHLVDPAKAQAVSAGTRPGPGVHPVVASAMREVGVDLSGAKPRLLTEDLARSARVLVTMGCGEDCPVVPGVIRLDWPLPDPKGLPLEEVRLIRDELRKLVHSLLVEHGWLGASNEDARAT
jgi:arsenate reductase